MSAVRVAGWLAGPAGCRRGRLWVLVCGGGWGGLACTGARPLSRPPTCPPTRPPTHPPAHPPQQPGGALSPAWKVSQPTTEPNQVLSALMSTSSGSSAWGGERGWVGGWVRACVGACVRGRAAAVQGGVAGAGGARARTGCDAAHCVKVGERHAPQPIHHHHPAGLRGAGDTELGESGRAGRWEQRGQAGRAHPWAAAAAVGGGAQQRQKGTQRKHETMRRSPLGAVLAVGGGAGGHAPQARGIQVGGKLGEVQRLLPAWHGWAGGWAGGCVRGWVRGSCGQRLGGTRRVRGCAPAWPAAQRTTTGGQAGGQPSKRATQATN